MTSAESAVRSFGAAQGRTIVYFHGCPGEPSECARFDTLARQSGVRLACIDRGRIDPALVGQDYFAALAAMVDVITEGRPVEIIGFSLGGFVAMRTAPLVKAPIMRLNLVSSAAPLECGDFIADMAGGAVFTMAKRSPRLFALASRVQGWLAALAPRTLFDLLFASASGADRSLASDASFREDLSGVLIHSLGHGLPGYVRDVCAYVAPWAEALAEVRCAVRIWQGDADTWSPPAMADCLADRLPAVVGVERLAGLSHYSCLFEAVPRIIAKPIAIA